MKKIVQYKNGNADIELLEDGTRTILFENELLLDFPLNVDIKISSLCALGLNSKTGETKCPYCHEDATTDGKECNYDNLKLILCKLPMGIELAIGGNKLTPKLTNFLLWAKNMGFISNLTVNHLQVNKFDKTLRSYFDKGLIKGLGISYRKGEPIDFDDYFIKHPDVILHVIAGIDDVDEIVSLPFKKVLVLGFKTFGRGVDYYCEKVEKNIQQWYWWVKKLIDSKDVVSFDNLSLEQLNVKRFLTPEKWEEFNQGENSIYINAVEEYFSPSSRSNDRTDWNSITIKEYFKTIKYGNKRN